MNVSDFKGAYHTLCAFELDDVLREVVRECPGADKASHMVAYGFIDPKEGLMIEVLGVGKQGPKYFYFRDPYEGDRITLHAFDVDGSDYMYFPPSQKSNYKKYSAQIDRINKDIEYPDDLEVLLLKNGLKKEKVWVHVTGIEESGIRGKLLNQPYQEFGINKGDSLSFLVRENNKHQAEFYIDFNVSSSKQSSDDKSSTVYTGKNPIITEADLKDGTILKQYIKDVRIIKDDNLFWFLITLLRSSRVVVPNEIKFDEKALKVIDSIGPNEEITDEKWDEISAGSVFLPLELKNDKNEFFLSVYSSKEEIGNNLTDTQWVEMPFTDVLDIATKDGADYRGILINFYSDRFLIERKLFDVIKNTKPFFNVNKEHVLVNVPKFPEPTPNVELLDPRNGINGVSISVGKMDLFNYALYHNDFEPIHGITIINETGSPIDKPILKITSDVSIFKPYEGILKSLPTGCPVSINDPHISVNGSELASLSETINANITIELIVDGKQIAAIDRKMKILAYDQWQGSLSYLELLPAFVQPNNPVISSLMHDVSENLKKHGKPNSLEGYQAEDSSRIHEFAKAAYDVIKEKSIVYANPPSSFMVQGQRIRTPEVVIDQKLGTCMDMTILYASLLESIGLHPILVLLKDHIFAGYWNRKRTIDELKSGLAIIEDPTILSKLISGGASEISLVECTCMCSDKTETFEQAKVIAVQELLTTDNQFDCSMDVYMLRHGPYSILPIPSRVKGTDGYKVDSESVKQESDENTLDYFDSLFDDSPKESVHKITNKKDLWESKLLDLTSRNMLLNLPKTSAVLPIMSSSISKLEDALSEGEEFSILPIPEWIFQFSITKLDDKGKETKPILWLEESLKTNGVFEITNWPSAGGFDSGDKILQEYKKHRLYSFYDQKLLDRDLTTIYRSAKKSQQENGVSSMYVALGLLRWIDAEAKQPHYAPLILIPVEIIRKSANQGYALHMRNEDPHFNSTLIEMLKQNYNLDLSALNSLPADEHGINVDKVFSTVRSAVFSIKGWNVVETCVLGNFSFAQFAMWNDIHSAGELLDNNKLVRSLMKGHVDWDINESEDDEAKVYLPISVDATQLRAIRMAAQGKTFVLHGPPGTGKSQTITAMIANLMAEGKRVLFVAEKKAALDVVNKRLKEIGLDDFCLEIHSDKADKKHVLDELENALNKAQGNYRDDYSEYEQMATNRRAKLDVYAKHLHETNTCGYSLRMLIAQYELVRDESEFIRFNQDNVGLLTYEDIKQHPVCIEQLLSSGTALMDIDPSKLSSIRLTSYGAEVRRQVPLLAEKYRSSLDNAFAVGDKVAGVVGTDNPKTISDLHALDSLISMYNANKKTDAMLVDVLNEDCEEIARYYNGREKVHAQKSFLLKRWHPEFLEYDMNDFLSRHEAAGKKLFGKANAMSAITEEIQAYSYVTLSYAQIPVLLEDVAKYQANEVLLQSIFDSLSEKGKKLLEDLPDLASYNKAREVAKDCQRQAEKFPGGLKAIMDISRNSENAELFDELEKRIKELEECSNAFNSVLVRRSDEKSEEWREHEIELCDYLIYHHKDLKDWAIYNKVRQDCFKVGLEPVVTAYENGMEPGIIVGAYKKGLYYALINNIIANDDDLSGFTGTAFNEAISQFKKADDMLLSKTKYEIIRILVSRIPSPTESPVVGREISILRKAISNNARGISLRELLARLPNILFRLCPCMLMSPNSVAQYLPQDNGLFDVVIFDEASQLPTCKAVGSLLRAKDAVVVGDPKQMPPTSFFAGGGPEVEDFAIADLDSILDDVIALGVPAQHLQWHYRSKHESLIAFSNNAFYKNRMYTFPSANDRERHVNSIYVKGVYKKGTNPLEAEAVVSEIVRRYNDPELRKQSIGVVTFNVSQQELIENLLSKQYQKDPEFDKWANNDESPVFVKNLENVQGDECDAIIFSICYGPDEKGKVSNNFGPINKTGGEKRLNVAFSRSKMSMTIITSMHSSDIHTNEDSPEGVKAFKQFLKYAEGSDIETESSERANASYSKAGIMQRICKELSLKGYECSTMIGHSDFHVDIAVVDPFDHDRYMLGILLDGDSYRQTKNTRDREVAQISVLKSLGWELCRVWTMDWWDNRDREFDRLFNKLEQLKAESETRFQKKKEEEELRREEREVAERRMQELKTELESQVEEVIAETNELDNKESDSILADVSEIEIDPIPSAEAPMEKNPISSDDSKTAKRYEQEETSSAVSKEYILIEYIKAPVNDNPITIEEFCDSGLKKDIAESIQKVVSIEAPIMKESLMRRVFEVYGVSKSTNSTEAFDKAYKYAKIKSVRLKGNTFCWSDEQSPDTYNVIRTGSDRSCDEICLQEVTNALCYILKNEGPQASGDLIKKVSLLFGYKRLGKNVETSLMNGLKWAISKNIIDSIDGINHIRI